MQSFVPYYGDKKNITPIEELLLLQEKALILKYTLEQKISILWSSSAPEFEEFLNSNLESILTDFEGLENLLNPGCGLLKKDVFESYLQSVVKGLPSAKT